MIGFYARRGESERVPIYFIAMRRLGARGLALDRDTPRHEDDVASSMMMIFEQRANLRQRAARQKEASV